MVWCGVAWWSPAGEPGGKGPFRRASGSSLTYGRKRQTSVDILAQASFSRDRSRDRVDLRMCQPPSQEEPPQKRRKAPLGDRCWSLPSELPDGWEAAELEPAAPTTDSCFAALFHGDSDEYFVYACVLGRSVRSTSIIIVTCSRSFLAWSLFLLIISA